MAIMYRCHSVVYGFEKFVFQVAKARDVGVNSIVLFPKIPDALKVLFSSVITVGFM